MSLSSCFPGTIIPVSEMGLLNGIFLVTSGITLSQVCEITGLENGTIQNWIKRGFVNPPVNRKYSRNQVARIILINMLRDTFTIDRIAKLLSYINGDLLDRSDDIMDDSDIYQCLCDILISVQQKERIETDSMPAIINEQLKTYMEPYPGAKDRLNLALQAMICAYRSATFKRYANQLTENI